MDTSGFLIGKTRSIASSSQRDLEVCNNIQLFPDGFPRTMAQAKEFEATVKEYAIAIQTSGSITIWTLVDWPLPHCPILQLCFGHIGSTSDRARQIQRTSRR